MPKGTPGHKAVLKVDAGGGMTTVATRNIPIADAYDTQDVGEQGDAAEAHLTTVRRVGMDLDLVWRPDEDAGQGIIWDAYNADPPTELDAEYYPLGEVQGKPVLSFAALVTSHPIDPGGQAGVVSATPHLQLSDGVLPTVDTVA